MAIRVTDTPEAMTTHDDVRDEDAPTELTVPQALMLAVRLHREGQLKAAETLYERVLQIAPNQPDALNFLGVLSLHRGRIDSAVELIARSIAIDPTQPDRYNNYGNVLLAAERVDDALVAYEQAIALEPAHADAHNNLGIIYKAQRRYEDADRAYKKAIALRPEHVEAYNNYGNLLAAQGQVREAIKAYSKALTLRPRDRDTRIFIAMAHVTLGELDAAAGIYRECLEEQPDDPGLKHLLAACSGEAVPERAEDAYIESTFDSFSTSFDAKLAILEYRAPQLVADALRAAGAVPDKRLAALDAGCGTGLCGPLIAPYVRYLQGVDLSSGMIEKARTRGVYDDLVKAELTQFLQGQHEAFDLIISADTLVYFGALADVFNAASQALRRGGLLILTLEEAQKADAASGHRLNPYGRYSHTRSYVEQTLREAGFAEVVIGDAMLRMERGEPVDGHVVTARKTC